ncbi:MAG TPA: hypothetical protein VFI47_27500 [Acidimicrobiales bacterium]|nr:hypothetical protein [Acidimicrobiales bacterium]
MYSTTFRRIGSVALGVAVVVTGACSGGGNSPSSAGSSTESVSTEVPGGVSAEALTPAGTELALGQTATVAVEHAGREGVVAVTVIGIKAGGPQDLPALGLANGEPYYVTMTIQNTSSPVDLGVYDPEPPLQAVQNNGLLASAVSEPDGFLPCPDLAPTELALGASFTTCEAFVAARGTVVVAVSYTPMPGNDPVIWK